MGRNRNKNLNNKYSQKLLGHTKQSAADALKTFSKTSAEILREKYISLELRKKIIDDLRLKKD